jgi:pyruvate kinase
MSVNIDLLLLFWLFLHLLKQVFWTNLVRQCQVLRGIYPLLVDSMEGTENIIHRAMLWGVKMGMAQKGDPIVVTSGVLEDTSGTTNIMRVLKCVGFEV